MTSPNDMVSWLLGVLDDAERTAKEAPGLLSGVVLARVEAERGIIAAWEEQHDFNGDPEGKMAAWTAVRWLAYGHRFDTPGWHQEWTPASRPGPDVTDPCESCGRRVWWWDSPPAWFEVPPGTLPGLGPEHTPQRCRWWRGLTNHPPSVPRGP